MIRELRYWTEYSAETADGKRCVTMKFPSDGTAMGTEVTDIRDGGLVVFSMYVAEWYPPDDLSDDEMFEIVDFLALQNEGPELCYQTAWLDIRDGGVEYPAAMIRRP